MVQVIRDPDVVRMENYSNINMIILPKFYLTPAGTASYIHDLRGRVRGELFLTWDNQDVIIKGYPEELWGMANSIEYYGYNVTIESPHKLTRCNIPVTAHETMPTGLICEKRKCSIISKIKQVIW